MFMFPASALRISLHFSLRYSYTYLTKLERLRAGPADPEHSFPRIYQPSTQPQCPPTKAQWQTPGTMTGRRLQMYDLCTHTHAPRSHPLERSCTARGQTPRAETLQGRAKSPARPAEPSDMGIRVRLPLMAPKQALTPATTARTQSL
jgi:hypothetical protein